MLSATHTHTHAHAHTHTHTHTHTHHGPACTQRRISQQQHTGSANGLTALLMAVAVTHVALLP